MKTQIESYRLMSNENPLGPSPKALSAIHSFSEKINYYPGWVPKTLKKKLATLNAVSPENISVSSGSYELINLITRFLINKNEEVLTFDNTFMAYCLSAKRNRRKCVISKMDSPHCNLKNLKSLQNEKTKAIFFANPNNPTGTIINHDSLRELLSTIPKTVFVVSDEAYIEYVTDGSYPDTIQLQKDFPNLIILRTFSKIYGLAGLRLGYGIASKEIVEKLDQVRILRSINALAEKAGEAAIDDIEYVEISAKHNATEREKMYREIASLGYNIIPSQANFLYLPFENNDRKNFIYKQLGDQGLMVCDLADFGHNKSLRITIGTIEANQKVIDCLGKLI